MLRDENRRIAQIDSKKFFICRQYKHRVGETCASELSDIQVGRLGEQRGSWQFLDVEGGNL